MAFNILTSIITLIVIVIILITKSSWSMELRYCEDEVNDVICKAKDNSIYDKRTIPGSPPLKVQLYFDIKQIIKVNEVDDSVTIILYLITDWEDRQLSYKKSNRTWVF